MAYSEPASQLESKSEFNSYLKIILMKTNPHSAKAVILLSMITCLPVSVLYAQKDFNLADYKNPDYNWRSLDFGFLLNGSASVHNNTLENISKDKYNQSQYGSGLNLGYSSVRNSALYQSEQNYRFNSSFSGVKNKTSFSGADPATPGDLESTHKQNSQSFGISISSRNRFYDIKKRFLEVNPNFSGNYGNDNSKGTSNNEEYPFPYKSQRNNYMLRASLPVLIGKGRIEAMQDARLAVYIFEDLQKCGDVKGNVSNEDILEFSSFITQIKNQRFFDYRIRKIAEITAIDSFLTEKGLKTRSGASYYTLLNDNWDNSTGPAREGGNRFSFGLKPGFFSSFVKSSDSYRDTLPGMVNTISYNNEKNSRLNSLRLDIVAGFVSEKPINLFWQRSANIDLSYSLYKGKSLSKSYERDSLISEQKNKFDNPDISFTFGYGLSYFPDSRTSISLSADAGFGQSWGDNKYNDDPKQEREQTDIDGGMNLQCSYYFSPQLRFSVNISSFYIYSKKTIKGTDGAEDNRSKLNSFNSNINASFTYSIF
jgi:hypothetical protein